jgi:sugar transferase (PEP-CTERM system associated)
MTILILVDILLTVLALFSAAIVKLGYSEACRSMMYEYEYLIAMVYFVIIVLFSSHLMEVYDLDKNVRKREILVNMLLASVASFALLSITNYLSSDLMVGRGILLIALLFVVVYQFCWHSIFMSGMHNPRFSKRVLVLGTGTLAAKIGEMAESNMRNYTLAGYALCGNNDLPSDKSESDTPVIPPDMILGTSRDLLATAQQSLVDSIVVALSEKRGIFPIREVLDCKLNGMYVMDAPTFYEIVNGKLMLESINPSWFIYSSGFHRTAIFNVGKRIFDMLLSTLGLIITLPFFPIFALAIKLDSPGPVFFSQLRVGRNEKPFMLYKFRTMRQDAEEKTGAVWAEKNDTRITRLGKFFRNSRIDELPQLINVLRGDMSFIGPRPERPEFVEKLKEIIPYYSKRHFIKPGLTGWAQVKYSYGSTIEDAIEKLRYDLYYIKNICPFLDVLIFLETIKVVLFGRGAR